MLPPDFDHLAEPDEDDKEAFFLPTVNKKVIKDIFNKQKTVYEDIVGMKSNILSRLSRKMSNVFLFMKKPIKVLSIQQVMEDGQWKEFLESESVKFREEAYELLVVLSSPQYFEDKEKEME